MGVWTKAPTDVAWFQFDWSGQSDGTTTPWLPSGAAITSYSVVVGPGLTHISDITQNGLVMFQVSGGVDGDQVDVDCQITTSIGETFATTKTIFIESRFT